MPKNKHLTICSVSYSNSEFFELNSELISRLNANTSFNWVVVENSPNNTGNRLDSSDARFQIVEGVTKEEANHWAPASLHHAQGLNIAVKHVDTRYLVVMDPDFFIILDDWMKIIPSFMESEDISIFGAPWNPRWVNKYRYFPSPHLSIYDLDKISIESLDFLPGDQNYIAKSPYHLNKFRLLKNRRSIACQPDTGWHIYQKYNRSESLFNYCVQPCFNPHEYLLDSNMYQINKVFDLMLPDSWSFIPKKKDYYSTKYFKDMDYPDTTKLGCEEFLWRDKPFGFHFRGYRNNLKVSNIINDLRELLCHIGNDDSN